MNTSTHNSSRMLVTSSWDDGSAQDVRLAQLLAEFDLTGTFYIPGSFQARGSKFSAYQAPTPESIRAVHALHEVGSHTLSHIPLQQLDEASAYGEIARGKRWVEDIIQAPAPMFAYPQGKITAGVEGMLEQAGCTGARLTTKLTFTPGADRFGLGVTVQVAPFPFRKVNASKYYLGRLLDPLATYQQGLLHTPSLIVHGYSWQAFARATFLHTLKHGSYFHLYGHAWEIERYAMWDDLKLFLTFVASHRDSFTAVTNGQVVDACFPARQ